MITQLNDIAQVWWQWMGSMFWQVSLFIILITALDMAIRKWAWPQVRYALWALVFIKLIIPPTWQMPTSIVSWIQPQVEEQISIRIDTMDWTESNSIIPDWNEVNPKISDSNDFTQSKGDEPVMVIKAKVTWQAFLFFGWIAGMIIFSFMLIKKMSKIRKSHQIQRSGKIPEWFHELIQKTANRLKLKKIPSVIFSKHVKSPAVHGVFKPVLLLPRGFLDQLSHKQAEHVLMHELCHLKRGDLLVHWFCIVLQIVYWFNPLLIWTRRQMRYVCEICCDLSVANILREKTRAYRNTLLNSACNLIPEIIEPGLGLIGIFEEPFRLIPRLKWLEKKTWENRNLKIVATICTSLFMVACVMPMSKSSQSETQDNEQIQFIRPMTGWISSGYGYRISPFSNEKEFHHGIDISARLGEPIYAAATGIVKKARFSIAFGYYIILQHNSNYQTRYAHCEKILVQEGQTVKSGDIIATCGNTGRSTGPHLCFELRKNGKAINPIEIYPESPAVNKELEVIPLKAAVKNNKTQEGTIIVSYRDFLDMVESGDIYQVTIQGDNLSGRSTQSIFRTYAPKDPELIRFLMDKGVNVMAIPSK